VKCSEGLSKRVSNIIRRRSFLLIWLFLLSYSFMFFWFYVFLSLYIWLYVLYAFV